MTRHPERRGDFLHFTGKDLHRAQEGQNSSQRPSGMAPNFPNEMMPFSCPLARGVLPVCASATLHLLHKRVSVTQASGAYRRGRQC